MAVPEAMTTSDISGRFILNKTFSDSTDGILTAQGVPWYTRKIIAVATMTVDVNHYTSPDDGFEHIDSAQILTGGIKGTQELRVLHGAEREHTDHIFDAVISVSKRISFKPAPPEVADNAFLHDGWTTDTIEAEKGVIYTRASSKTEVTKKVWTAEQVWGFEIVDGEKRYARHVHFFTPDEKINAKLIYDYIGPVPA